MSDLTEWYLLDRQLKEIKEKEMTLRKKICSEYFAKAVEGANTYVLENNAALKSVLPIHRAVDEAGFATLKLLTTADCSPTLFGHKLTPPKLTEKIVTFLDIRLDDLVNWTPELKVSEYRKLNDVQREIFDNCLLIKPGTPSLEILVKKAK